MLLKSLLTQTERNSVPPHVRQRLNRHWRLLEQAERDDRAAFRAALAYPSVGDWLMHALTVPPGRGDVLGALAAAVALRTGTAFRLTLPAPGGLLTFPGVGVYSAHAGPVRVVAGPRSLRLTPAHRRTGVTLRPPYNRAAAPGWRGPCPLPGGGALLDDIDPRRAGALPAERSAPAIAGGTGADTGRARDWRARWHAALALLSAADPERRSEVGELVRSVVPLVQSPRSTFSATLGSAPGAVLTQLPETASEFLTVLVHETHHSKLAVLEDMVPLRDVHGGSVHRVGWRPDPRPVGAVLQGAYAHLALADVWHRLGARTGATPSSRAAARARREDYREQVGDAIGKLRRCGELTPAGEKFTEAMTAHLTGLTERPARRLAGGRARARQPCHG